MIDLEEAAAAKDFRKANIVVTDLNLEEALAPSEAEEGPTVTDEAPDIQAPQEPTSPHIIAEAIKSAIASARSQTSHKSSIRHGSSRRAAQSSSPRIRIVTPPMSERGKEEIEVEEEIDMMPHTPAEKHLFWKTKLQTLKMSFNHVTIPKDIEMMTWEEVRKIYYIQLDQCSIGKNVDSYKLIMVVLFFIIEYVGARFLKVDITGYTVHSLKSMHRFERLLIELGEKDYSSFGENWPVEVRIAGLVLVNAVIFVIAKAVFKATGNDMSEEFFDLFNSLGSQSVEDDLPQGAGMDAPAPQGAGGLMGILGGILGSFAGGGGGLGGLFGGGGGGAQQPAAQTDQNQDQEGNDEGGERQSRIRPPRYRRKKPKTD